MKEEFKSACERSGYDDIGHVCLPDFVAAYGTANLVKLHEIYSRDEMPLDDAIVFAEKYFRSDLAAAIIVRDAKRNRNE